MKSNVLVSLALAASFVGVGSAQVTARLSGSVVDPTGAAVPGATVDILLPGGVKPILSAVTTAEGVFSFIAIPPSTYSVVVSAKGFRKSVQENVILATGEERSMPPIHLEVGSTSETVEVRDNAETIQTSNSEISTNVSKQQVKDLPILNRSPQGFVDTQAGVNMSRGGDSVINGQRTSFSNVTLDGINIQDNYIRTNAVDFSPNLLLVDQVAEFTISTSNANPAAGGGASQVMFVTPSGNNQYHGGVFWSNRNSALAANTWFNNQAGVARPFLNQNQTGGNLGGPIKKDKLFFYFNYEFFDLKQTSGQQRTILTADATQGLFTYLNGGAVQKVNILTATGQKVDPAIASLISKIPPPSAINNFNSGDSSATLLRNTGGYLFNQRSDRKRNNVTGKIDYVMSTKSSLSGTYAYNTDLLDRPDVQTVGYQAIPPVNNNDTVNLLSVGWRYNPAATLTNEARFGFNFAPALFLTNQDFGNDIIGGTLFSTPVATFRGQGRWTDTYNFADNASYYHGAHSIQFGFQLQDDHTKPYNDAGITPTYTVGISTANANGLTNAQLPGASSSDISAANNLLATLAGFISSYSQTYNVQTQSSGYVNNYTQVRNWEFSDYSAYVTDTWRVKSNFTATLGLRYEYYTPVKEQNGLVLLPQLGNNSYTQTLFSNSTLNFAPGGSLYRPDRTNFSPNVGLAWTPSPNGKTVLRAGYSVNFVNDEFLTALTSNANTNSGLSQTVTNPTALANIISQGLPSIATPTFQVPRTFQDNYNLSPTVSFGMADPSLRTPYVQQWNFDIQRELKGGVILDARYVGNHGTKLLRALDLNQININSGGFLADFLRAQKNGQLAQAANGVFTPAYNANIPGSQPLTVFPLMPNGGNLTNSTNITYLQQGAVADMAYNYQSTKANGPINFFPNPYATSLRLMTNFSNSTYNALQVEVRTRDYHGLTMQANYTYAKALTDAASGSDNSNQGRFEPLIDNNNPSLAKSRALWDERHVIKLNYVYRLPFGDGHRLGFKPINRVISGWQMSGILNRQSGYPYSVCSGIGTFNRNNILGTNDCNTVNTTMNLGQLQNVMQFRMSGNGPYMVAANAIGTDGRAAVAGALAPFNGQVFYIPPAGTIGTLQQRVFTGPWDTNFDFGLSKATRIHERHEILLRMDSTNFFNHPAFSIGDQTVTSTTFGKITGTFNGRRAIQFTLQYRF
jgi:hypothetical protein